MRLTGTSFHGNNKRSPGDIKFDELIPKANALLRGEIDLPGMEPDQIRDKLLAGFQFVLVDEYQDIDAEQYEMISALTGRTLKSGEDKLSILAVGDDDQSIYGFRKAISNTFVSSSRIIRQSGIIWCKTTVQHIILLPWRTA